MADNNDTSSLTVLYNALKYKKYSKVRRLCRAHPEYVLQEISVYNDTALHIAAHSKQTDLVLDLLNILPADDNRKLSGVNDSGNTVLHEVATSDAMKDAAEELLKRNEDLLTASNVLGEKPIFCAARYGQTQMFKFLADQMELNKLSEEESKAHLRRNDGTTVLHISIATECFALARNVAREYGYLIEEKDRNSMTALQSLACNSSAFTSAFAVGNFKGHFMEDDKAGNFKEKFMEANMISKQKIKWMRKCARLLDLFMNVENESEKEKFGFSMFFEAKNAFGLMMVLKAYKRATITVLKLTRGVIEGLVNLGLSPLVGLKKLKERWTLEELVKLLVMKDTTWDECTKESEIEECSSKRKGQNSEESSNSKNKKSDESPLFLATMFNIEEIVKAFLDYRPEALNRRNKEGMNILHVAILYRRIDIFDMVVKDEVFVRRLVSTTDKEENSILHMVSQRRKSQASEKMQNPAMELRDELRLFEKVKSVSKMNVSNHLNNDNKTAEELFAATNEQLHQDAREWLMRTTENCTILSVFIATVAFAAAYTVPGGPNQDTGIPILHSKPFFLVFILADVISLTLALTSVGIFFSILTSSFPLENFKMYLFKKLKLGVICLVVSVAMMAVAFGATIVLLMTKNIVWDVVAFLPVPIFFLSCSPLRSLILGPFREPFKIFVVYFYSLVFYPLFMIGILVLCLFCGLIYLVFHLVFKGLVWTVQRACGYNFASWIIGHKSQSGIQSPQPTASPPAQV